ncbi:MAG: NfeD family protein [Elainellaceae cyanobacterium]
MMRVLKSQLIEAFPNSEPGTVEETITPNHGGRVHFQATSWPARLYPGNVHTVLLPGESVAVVDREGITLLVTPMQSILPVGFPVTVPMPIQQP